MERQRATQENKEKKTFYLVISIKELQNMIKSIRKEDKLNNENRDKDKQRKKCPHYTNGVFYYQEVENYKEQLQEVIK